MQEKFWTEFRRSKRSRSKSYFERVVTSSLKLSQKTLEQRQCFKGHFQNKKFLQSSSKVLFSFAFIIEIVFFFCS